MYSIAEVYQCEGGPPYTSPEKHSKKRKQTFSVKRRHKRAYSDVSRGSSSRSCGGKTRVCTASKIFNIPETLPVSDVDQTTHTIKEITNFPQPQSIVRNLQGDMDDNMLPNSIVDRLYQAETTDDGPVMRGAIHTLECIG